MAMNLFGSIGVKLQLQSRESLKSPVAVRLGCLGMPGPCHGALLAFKPCLFPRMSVRGGEHWANDHLRVRVGGDGRWMVCDGVPPLLRHVVAHARRPGTCLGPPSLGLFRCKIDKGNPPQFNALPTPIARLKALAPGNRGPKSR